MGNVVEALKDITEEGNTWQQDGLRLPTFETALGSHTRSEFEAVPRLFVAPLCRDQRPADRCEETSTRVVSSDGISTKWKPFELEKPSQVILRPGYSLVEPRRNHPWVSEQPRDEKMQRKTKWIPLSSCRMLTNRVTLTEERLLHLRPHLPLATRFATAWKLLYCPLVHGVSIRTFFRQCQAWPGETLLLIEDTNGAVFGGFASHTWQVARSQHHYGIPECFIFRFLNPEEEKSPVVYPWAGGNQYFMFASLDGLAMGGGRSRALWIDKDFLTGNSAPCETFGNREPLSASTEFVIRNIECWGFDSSFLALNEASDASASSTVDPESPISCSELQSKILRERLRREASDALRFRSLF